MPSSWASRVWRAGLIGAAIVVQYRPPSGIGDAMGMLLSGRSYYIKEPLFEILLGLAAICALVGVVRIVSALQADAKKLSPEERQWREEARQRVLAAHYFGDGDICRRCGKDKETTAILGLPCDEAAEV